MKTLRERSKDLAFALQHEAQTERIYKVIEEHMEMLRRDTVEEVAGSWVHRGMVE